MLVLRNSFALVEPHQQKIIQKLSLNNHLLFKPTHEILNELVKRSSQTPLDLQAEIAELRKVFFSVKHISQQADITLKEHSEALETKALNPLFELEKKMLRAARKKQVTENNQVSKLKAALFPNGSLQERVENFAIPYSKYGPSWLTQLFENSPSLDMQFTLLYLPE
jgi:bacillithiol synthase